METAKYFYNGTDLRTATVFDLTADESYIARFLSPELGINTIEDYLALGEPNTLNRVSNMLDFAEENNITELIEKLKDIYADDLVAFFNE